LSLCVLIAAIVASNMFLPAPWAFAANHMGPDELTRKHAVIGPFDPLPPGGEAVLGPEPELEFVLFGARRANGVLSVVDVEGMPFKKAIRAQTLVKPPYVYNIQTIAH